MRRIGESSIWIGHVGHASDVRLVRGAGIEALVHLALNEAPVVCAREMVSVRVPLVDGAGNPPALLRLAVQVVAGLMREGVPTLVFCGAGMSRSPAVVAAAMARVTGRAADECLCEVFAGGPADVSPMLWGDLVAVV
jgi:hypothetical protein